jgi:hydroxymethylpyrimidine/phosphomethylpyrimidine kinase
LLLVRAQIDAVASDLHPDAAKSGMLANAPVVRVVAAALRTHAIRWYVLDPVIVSSSGTALLDRDGVRALRRDLLPLATVVTPNLAEASALTGEPVNSIASMRRAALLLVDRDGAKAALITGGHLEGGSSTDVFYDGKSAPRLIRHRRIATRHTHGTGCALSAAIAARLALGDSLLASVTAAGRYVHRALLNPPSVGSGTGPVG